MNLRLLSAVAAVFLTAACGSCGDDPSLVGDDVLVIDTDPDGGTMDAQDPVVIVDLGTPDLGDCSPEREDAPDPHFFDANCDGIDGDIAKSVFVASYGDDANPGTQALPKASIDGAILTASAEGKAFVLVADGLFDGGFELLDGVSVAGGYGFGWERNERFKTSIRGGNPAITGRNIQSDTLLTGFDVEPTRTPEPGETVVTVYLESSPGVRLENVKIVGGVGGDGAPGSAGFDGDPGGNGSPGENGREDSGVGCKSDGKPNVGLPGTASCAGANGGTGGEPGKGDNDGQAGQPSPGGAAGGTPGPKSQPAGDGDDGMRGTNGMPGAGGTADGTFLGSTWIGQDGLSGGEGAFGIGGGGGGGGGGGDSFCDSWGGAGGGGGAGGCGGRGGGGGGHGGASVALLLIESDIRIVGCTIIGGAGGAGGSGGEGGSGGRGGLGGPGGDREDDSGIGGKGGDGGVGGRGGQGGGGAGGPAFAIYTQPALSRMPVNTELTKGMGGFGGIAAAAAGKGADGRGEGLFTAP